MQIKIPVVHRLTLVALILIGFTIMSYVSLSVFCNYPFSMDEYNYLYQAKIFASGHLYLNPNPKLADLSESYMFFSHGKMFSKFPPGFPFFLSFGVKLGIAGLINPLLSVGTMLLIYFMMAELSGSLFALLALLMLVSNSYFLAYGASYFAHPASLFLLTLTLFFYQRHKNTKRIIFLCAAASAISLATLVRPLDAFCLWIVLCFDVGTGKIEKKFKSLLLFSALSVIGTMLLVSYNKILTGRWCIAPYPIWDSNFKLFYGGEGNYVKTVVEFLKVYQINLKNVSWPLLTRYFLPYFICWVPLLILSLFGQKQKQPNFKALRLILFVYSLLIVVLYNVHSTFFLDWPQYGARYWYPLIIPLVLLLIEGSRVLYAISSRWVFLAILGLCVLWQTCQSVSNFYTYAERFRIIQKIQADINKNCPAKSIVILNQPKKWKSIFRYFTEWKDFKRNPFMNGPRLYVIMPKDLRALQSVYPDYSICSYCFIEPCHTRQRQKPMS